MRIPHRSLIAAGILSLVAASQAQAEALDVQRIEAVWKVQSIPFSYSGASTSYSCTALRKRVRSILRRMGAHESIEVHARACYDLSDLALLQITMASPVAATPENVAALTEYDATDELVARVRGEALDSAADLERFDAQWRTISLARDKSLKLAPGDCELVEQLRREVLPLMSVRVVDDRLRCSNAFGNYVRPQLTVSALVPFEAGEGQAARISARNEAILLAQGN